MNQETLRGLMVAVLPGLLLLGGCTLISSVVKKPPSAYQRGMEALRHDRYADADVAFNEVSADDENYPRALSARAKIAMKQGRPGDAHATLHRLKYDYPDHFDEYDARRYDEAFSTLVVAAELGSPGKVRHIAGGNGVMGVLSESTNGLTLSGYDLGSARQTWSVALGGRIDDAYDEEILFADGRFVVVDRRPKVDELVAVDASSGQVAWSSPTGTHAKGVTVRTSGDLVLTPFRRKVADPQTGQRRQQIGLEALRLSSGEVAWSVELDATVETMCTAAGRVFFRDRSGALHSRDATTGDEVWSFGFGPEAKSNDELVCADGQLFLVASDDRLYAFDARDEHFQPPLDRVRWTASAKHPAAPAVHDGAVWLPQRKKVVVLRTSDGKPLHEVVHGVAHRVVSRGMPPLRAVAVDDTILLGYGGDGAVALTPEGEIRWRFTGRPLSSTPLFVDGEHAYVGASDTGTDSSPAILKIPLRPSVAY